MTPARIAQALYDTAELLAAARYGWLGLGIAISECSNLHSCQLNFKYMVLSYYFISPFHRTHHALYSCWIRLRNEWVLHWRNGIYYRICLCICGIATALQSETSSMVD